jgi:hypothetical protein
MTYFWEFFNTNLNQIKKKFKNILKDFFEDFFQEYSKNIPKNNHLGATNGSYLPICTHMHDAFDFGDAWELT